MVKKTAPMDDKRKIIDIQTPELSARRQCETVGLSRCGFYYLKATVSAQNLEQMRRMDEAYTPVSVHGQAASDSLPEIAAFIPICSGTSRLHVSTRAECRYHLHPDAQKAPRISWPSWAGTTAT